MRLKQYLIPILNAKRLLIVSFLLAFLVYMLGPYNMIYIKAFAKLWGPDWLPKTWGFHAFKLGWHIVDIPKILTNSLGIAGLAVLISTLIGIPTGWALGRRGVPGKEFLLSMFLLPRLIPPIAFALGVAKIFYRVNLVDTHLGVALAHVAICAPYSILILCTTFEGLDERLLEAARVCGANARKTFFHVILPLILPGILSSMIFTFTASYSEFTLTLMTYGPHTVTLPVQAYLSIGDGFLDVASAISVILFIPSLLILLVLQRWLRPERLIGGIKGA
jgi:putative spermidine/putrescine transport system permease protein